VQSGRFGACLMAEPDLVAQCYDAMAQAVNVPVTVKCRLGIDDQEPSDTLPEFIEKVAAAGCTHFIIHARKAWLKGLSPKENRDVPPLDYGLVRQIKRDNPQLEILLNGGIKDIETARAETETLDGVMLGRAAYNDPWILTQVDEVFYGEAAFTRSREDIIGDLIGYARSQQETDRTTKALIRHIMGLFAGQVGARLWRRSLSEGLISKAPPSDIIAMAYGAQYLPLILILLAVGGVSGLSAGLFGIGGGSVMVPALFFAFNVLGVSDDVLMHCAVATSSAIIIVNAARSVSSHHQRGAVDWDLLWPKQIWQSYALWIGIGSFLLCNLSLGGQIGSCAMMFQAGSRGQSWVAGLAYYPL